MTVIKNILNCRLEHISLKRIEIKGPAHLSDAAQLWVFDERGDPFAYCLEIKLNSNRTNSPSHVRSLTMRLEGPIRGSISMVHSTYFLKSYAPYDSRILNLFPYFSSLEPFDQAKCIFESDCLALKISFVGHGPLYIWSDYHRAPDQITFSENENFSLERLGSLGYEPSTWPTL
jgi:hypothetical protein